MRGAFVESNKPNHRFIANIVEADPTITAYATHARLVSMAEELMGGEARIVEMNAHMNSRDPDCGALGRYVRELCGDGFRQDGDARHVSAGAAGSTPTPGRGVGLLRGRRPRAGVRPL